MDRDQRSCYTQDCIAFVLWAFLASSLQFAWAALDSKGDPDVVALFQHPWCPSGFHAPCGKAVSPPERGISRLQLSSGDGLSDRGGECTRALATRLLLFLTRLTWMTATPSSHMAINAMSTENSSILETSQRMQERKILPSSFDLALLPSQLIQYVLPNTM